MKPEEIESREFFVSMRGYDRGEVRAFLREVAAAHRTARGLDGDTPAPDVDPIDQLGHHVAAVVRAAEVASENMRRDAEAAAEQLRNEIEQEAQQVLADAEARAEAIETEATEHGQAAERTLASANEEAARLLEETERLLEQSERDAKERSERIVADALRRRDAVLATCDEISAVLHATVADARQQLEALEEDEAPQPDEARGDDEQSSQPVADSVADRPDPWDAWSDAR